MADILKYMAVASFLLIGLAFIMMILTYTAYTKGYWKTYIKWLMISGLLMGIYLVSSVLSKLDMAKGYANLISIIGFVLEAIAALTYIKSSSVLDLMGTKYGFAKKGVSETLKLKPVKVKDEELNVRLEKSKAKIK